MPIAGLLFSFRGRLNRRPFWITLVLVRIASWTASALLGALQDRASGPSGNAAVPGMIGAIIILMILAEAWITLAVGAKRLHDRDRSGYFLLVLLIPAAGLLWLLIEVARKGTGGLNRFGPDPLAQSCIANIPRTSRQRFAGQYQGLVDQAFLALRMAFAAAAGRILAYDYIRKPKSDWVPYAQPMFLLTVTYLVFELGFNARLLDVIGTQATDQEISGIEQWGRLISGVAVTLAVWGTMVFPAFHKSPRLEFFLLPALALSAGLCIVVTYTQEKRLVDTIVDASTGGQRRDAIHLEYYLQALLRGDAAFNGVSPEALRQPEGKALIGIIPLMSLSDPALRANIDRILPQLVIRQAQQTGKTDPQVRSYLAFFRLPAASFEDGERFAPYGRRAMLSLVVPPIALTFSLIGALVHSFKVSNYASILTIPRFRGREILVFALVGGLAFSPYLWPNDVSQSDGFRSVTRDMQDQLRASPSGGKKFIAPVPVVRWVVQGQPFLYPVNDWIRRNILLGSEFRFDLHPWCEQAQSIINSWEIQVVSDLVRGRC